MALFPCLFASFSMAGQAGAHEGWLYCIYLHVSCTKMFHFDLEHNHKPILNPIATSISSTKFRTFLVILVLADTSQGKINKNTD